MAKNQMGRRVWLSSRASVCHAGGPRLLPPGSTFSGKDLAGGDGEGLSLPTLDSFCHPEQEALSMMDSGFDSAGGSSMCSSDPQNK